MNAHDEIVKDSDGIEVGSVHTHHNGLSVVWAFKVAGGPQATLSYQNKKAAFFGLLRVVYGKAELISVKRAKPVAAANVSKGCAHVVRNTVRTGLAGRVLGIVTNVRTDNQGDGDLVYITFDDFIELVFDTDDQLDIVE